MGWDAFATKNGKDLKVNYAFQGHNSTHLVDPKIRAKFEYAKRKVLKSAEYVDGLLPNGGLDISNSAFALEEATGMSCWGDDLNPDSVKHYFKVANWDNVSQKATYKYSAKEFLRVCAQNGFGIRFSW